MLASPTCIHALKTRMFCLWMSVLNYDALYAYIFIHVDENEIELENKNVLVNTCIQQCPLRQMNDKYLIPI